jgi:ketosteroid isomerase-like protein
MSIKEWLLGIVLLASATDVGSAGVDCLPDAAAVREVRAVATGIVAADNQRDIERVVAYYSADAVLMPPGEAPVVGRDSIRPRYEALFAAFTPEIELRVEEACAGAGLAFVRGHNGGRLIPRASGEVRVLDDAFVMLLRLEPGGVWRISHLIWHRQSGPASAPPANNAELSRMLQEDPRCLVAATEDRFLMKIGRKQRLGTSTNLPSPAGTGSLRRTRRSRTSFGRCSALRPLPRRGPPRAGSMRSEERRNDRMKQMCPGRQVNAVP